VLSMATWVHPAPPRQSPSSNRPLVMMLKLGHLRPWLPRRTRGDQTGYHRPLMNIRAAPFICHFHDHHHLASVMAGRVSSLSDTDSRPLPKGGDSRWCPQDTRVQLLSGLVTPRVRDLRSPGASATHFHMRWWRSAMSNC
jgi:hypothetical protein